MTLSKSAANRMAPSTDREQLLGCTVDIVCSFLEGNSCEAGSLQALVLSVHGALVDLTDRPAPSPEAKLDLPQTDRPSKAEIRRSIQHDGLVSFEDGRTYKMLARHITKLGMTPEQYRRKWGLPHDYPMTCRQTATRRSEVAKAIGLGVVFRANPVAAQRTVGAS